MMINLDPTHIRELFNQIQGATEDVFCVELAYMSAKQNLERCKAAALLAGEITGKNQAERDAALHDVLTHELRELEGVEIQLKEAKLKLELLNIERQYLDRVLRLGEIEAKIEAAPF